jgi:hypothetical protein
MTKLAFAGMLLALLIPSRPATSAVAIDFVEGDHTVAVGVPFTLQLRISGDGALLDPPLRSFGIEIGFSKFGMAFDGVHFGDPVLGDQLDFDGLADKSVVGPFDGGAILSFVRIAETSNDLTTPLHPGVFVLATLTFHALASGPTQIGVYETTLDGYDGGYPEVFMGASTITAVPEPSSLLWALGALGLIAGRRIGAGGRTR